MLYSLNYAQKHVHMSRDMGFMCDKQRLRPDCAYAQAVHTRSLIRAFTSRLNII